MKLVMTVMVRDEVDIMAAMVEHHLAQGVDLIIATDNGSTDGTREILAQYAATGRVELHDYLTHDKNQTGVVSQMASRAFTEHGADWVLNADADEFFVPVDRSLTLRDAFAQIPQELGSFSIPVVNLTGAPAKNGTGLRRLVWRDVREESTLMETVALHAHPTAVVAHVGRAEVTVQQGNHGVDIASLGQPDPSLGIEVLHIPWRSYHQYRSKVENTGLSYEANPALRPSPRHHGMRDFRFLRAGLLEDLYIVRHRLDGDAPGFIEDTWLVDRLSQLLDSGEAVCADQLATLLHEESTTYPPERLVRAREVADVVIPMEIEHLAVASRWRDAYRAEARRAKKLRGKIRALEEKLQEAEGGRLHGLRSRARRLPSRVRARLQRKS